MNTDNKIIDKFHSHSMVDTLRFIVVILFVTACSQTVSKPTKLNLEELAQSAYQEQNFNAARAYYEQALQGNPTIESYVGLAKSLENIEEWYNASEIWFAISQIETIEPSVQGTYITNASKNLLRSNDVVGAKTTINALNAEQIQTKSAQTMLGLISVIDSQKNSAISIFNALSEKFSNDLSVQTNLGLTYLVFDEPDKAIEILGKIPDGESSILNHAIAKAYFGKENDAFILLQTIQTDDDAKQTIEFAKHLKNQNVKTRAKLLFGISNKD